MQLLRFSILASILAYASAASLPVKDEKRTIYSGVRQITCLLPPLLSLHHHDLTMPPTPPLILLAFTC